MGDLNLLYAIATSSDVSVAASSTLNGHNFSVPHNPTSVKNLIMNSSSNCHISGQTTSRQPCVNAQTGKCVQTQQLSLNQYPATVQTLTASCNSRPHRFTNTSGITNNNQRVNILQNSLSGNQNIQNNSLNSTPDCFKTASHRLHSVPLDGSQTFNENMGDQHFFPPASQDFVNKLPKSLSFCTDYEMACSGPLVAAPHSASAMPLAAQDLNLLNNVALTHSVSSDRTLSSVYDISRIQETTVYHSLTRTAARVSARAPLSSFVSNHSQPTAKADVMDNRVPSSSSTPNTPPRGGSVNECPSPQVSDLGSEDTNVSINQQSFAQNYASLTPWTSKLTAPGYVPLPKPAPDAMPIPLEHTSNEHVLLMSSLSQEMSAQSWHARPYQIYSHLKHGKAVGCYSEAHFNSKTKSEFGSGTLHAQRPGYKILPNKEYRFRRTADALQKSGLWEVAMKTGSLMKRNRELQKELEEFRSDAVAFLKSVIKNPQNRDFIKNVLNTALTSNTASRNGSSVMTVVVSAVAAAAAASVRLDSSDSSDDSMSGNTST